MYTRNEMMTDQEKEKVIREHLMRNVTDSGIKGLSLGFGTDYGMTGNGKFVATITGENFDTRAIGFGDTIVEAIDNAFKQLPDPRAKAKELMDLAQRLIDEANALEGLVTV